MRSSKELIIWMVEVICLALFATSVFGQTTTGRSAKVYLSPERKNPEERRGTIEFQAVKDGVMLVRTDTGAGSGFLLRQDGKKYLVTNLHVIEDATKIAAFFHNGERLPLGQLFIDLDNDLARFEVETDKPGFAPCEGEPTIGEPVFIYGDSQGAGVLTEIKGRIIGVGPLDVETDANFIQGNSGSALLNGRMEVVGVATYMKMRRDQWNAETRFGNVRRFAVRIDRAKWRPSSINDLIRRRKEEMVAEIMSLVVPADHGIDRKTHKATISTLLTQKIIRGKRGSVGMISVNCSFQPEYKLLLLCSTIVDYSRKGGAGYGLRTELHDFAEGKNVWNWKRTIAGEESYKCSAERLSMEPCPLQTRHFEIKNDKYFIFQNSTVYYRLEVWYGGEILAVKEGPCNNGTVRPPREYAETWFVPEFVPNHFIRREE